MNFSTDTIKNIAPFAVPFVSAFIETKIKPALEDYFRRKKIDDAVLAETFNSKFTDYYARAYDKHSFISTLVFQNQRMRLEELYVPLRVTYSRNEPPITLDGYRDEFLPRFRKILVVDTAGMGKSTLSKYLFIQCINSKQGLPILIELRQLRDSSSIIDFVSSQLNSINDELDQEFICELINRGEFVFFLDGYDEISPDMKEGVTTLLEDFISKSSNNLFIMTSRPDEALASFSGFQRFSINPLTHNETFDLIRKYDRFGTLSDELIDKLKNGLITDLSEFLVNPLLVSLLFKCYDYKRNIPIQKYLFYDQVYESLFENHDLTKGGAFNRPKHCKLDIDNFKRVLRALGLVTFQDGRLEYERDELISYIERAVRLTSCATISPNSFLRDLLETVPLFVKEGVYYRWVHKSLQEYFCSSFICYDSKTKQKSILDTIYRSRNILRHFNILDLCYEMDYKTFRNVIIDAVISSYERYVGSTYTEIDQASIPHTHVTERQRHSFSIRVFLTKSGLSDLNIDSVSKLLNENGLDVKPGEILWHWQRLELIECIGLASNDAVILHLLGQKGDLLSTWTEYGLLNEDVENLIECVNESVILVDDDPKGVVNLPSRFDIVTRLIIHLNRGICINPEVLDIYRRDIIDDLKLENSDELSRGFA